MLLNDGNWSGMPPAQQASGFNVSGFPSPTTRGSGRQLHRHRPGQPRQRADRLHRHGPLHQQRRAGRPARRLHLHGRRPGRAYLQRDAEDGGHASRSRPRTRHCPQARNRASPSTRRRPARFTVAGFPSPVTAGAIGNFTVTALDPYGNRATGYTGTIHVSSSDARAVLPGNYTFTTADAGVHSFSATLKTAGTQAITTTDTATANINGTLGSIRVTPAAASQFVIAAPSSVTAGVRFSLTITVEDAYGNVVTGYTGRIHFSSTDSGATLPANYTFAATDHGVHTFTGLKLKKKGKQTIQVTDTLNSSLMGKSIINVL